LNAGPGQLIAIRRARAKDGEALTTIAHQAKRYWKYPEPWIDEWKDLLTLTPSFIRSHSVYLAMEGPVPIGFYTLSGKGARLVLEHLWVVPDRIGRGVGRRLFKHARMIALRRKATIIVIESDPNAAGFYERMGARQTGQTVSAVAGQPRVLPRFIFKVKAGP
jgi:GNAT superfamily N-acetyltransferase